jgi:hypothetical protein
MFKKIKIKKEKITNEVDVVSLFKPKETPQISKYHSLSLFLAQQKDLVFTKRNVTYIFKYIFPDIIVKIII